MRLIDDAITDLPSEAETKRQSLQISLRNGQFSSLRDLPEELLKSARGQIAPIQGQLLKIEERLNQVKRNAIGKVNSWLPELKPLFTSQKQSEPVALTFNDVATLSVSELQLICDKTLSNWQNQGEQILESTGLTLTDWRSVYQALSQGQEPILTPAQQQALVDKGILKMRLTFATGL